MRLRRAIGCRMLFVLALSACAAVGPETSEGADPCMYAVPLPDYGIADADAIAIYDRAARALAEFQEPVYDENEVSFIILAFKRAFDGNALREEWLTAFAERVARWGLCDVRIVLDNPTTAARRVTGRGAYLRVTRTCLANAPDEHLVLIGPYRNPMQFIE